MSTDKKISTLVEQQFPQFARDDGPNLVAFVKAYYEWTEQANNAIEVSKNLINYQDIDNTYDKYLEYFHREIMDNIPRSTLADRKKLAKHAKDMHRARGSELSYRLLFRLLYNEEIDFYYPGEDMLRASDGRWLIEKSVRIGSPRIGVTTEFDNQNIEGLTSGATAKVDKIIGTLSGGALVDELYLLDIVGAFQDNEKVALVSNNSIYATIVALSGPLQGVLIHRGGALHRTDDIVTFTSTSGVGASGAVTATNDQSAVQWSIANGGSGYTTGATINITDNGGAETAFTIDSISATESLSIMTNTIAPVANVVLNTGPLFVSAGANTASVGTNFASANVASTLASLDFDSITVGTIASITTTNYGYGYSTLPTSSVIQQDVANSLLPDGSGGFKGLNANINAENAPGAITSVNVSTFGTNYNRDDEITISNSTRAGTQAAIGTPFVSGVVSYPGKYVDTKGWLSWNNKLQDNRYYQDYSYEINSDEFTNTYRKLVNDIVHPAGTKMFGRVRLFSEAEPPIVTTASTEVSYKIQSEITINLPQVTFINTANTIPTIERISILQPTLGTIETDVSTFALGRGSIAITSNNIIGAYQTVVINTYATLDIGSLGSPKALIGNGTFFTSDIPTSNTKIKIVDRNGPTANGVYFIDTTSSNTATTIKTVYAAATLANGVFYYNTQQSQSYSIDVINSGSSAYTLSGVDRLAGVSGNNQTITVNVGDTINLVVNASGHPLYIKTTAGTGTGDQVTTPTATNQGAQVGTVTWVPNTAGTYYYQCSNHGVMVGTVLVRAQGTK
jgi:plastocyanin